MAVERIAQIVGNWAGGGVESVVLNYYRHIDRNRYQFDIYITEQSTCVPKNEIELLGGEVIVMPPLSRPDRLIPFLEEEFRIRGYSVVHSHVNSLSVFPLMAAKRAGVPGRIAHSHSTSGKGEYVRNAVKLVLKQFSRVYPTDLVACSEYAGHWLFGGTGFTVLSNAVDTLKFYPDEEVRNRVRGELGIAPATFTVGHIGRFMEQKNHAFLLETFSRVLELEADSRLVLVGSGPLEKDVKAHAVRLGIDGAVTFLGQRSDTEKLYQAFDVFCLPSLYEGLPVVGIECQASGTPILASDAMTSETKISSLLDFESLSALPETWAQDLLAMRGRVLTEADKRALGDFDISKAAGRLMALYDDIIERKKGKQ